MMAKQQQQRQIDKRSHCQILMCEPLEPDASDLLEAKLSREEPESSEPDDDDSNEADDFDFAALDAEESHGPTTVVVTVGTKGGKVGAAVTGLMV